MMPGGGFWEALMDRVFVILAAVVLTGLTGPALTPPVAHAAAPKPGLEVIRLPGEDAEYLVDRARNLCFFRSGTAMTPVDCGKLVGAGPAEPAPVRPEKPRRDALGKGATLVVTSRPWSTITVDGVAVGSAPATIELAPGAHEVQLTKGDQTANARVQPRRGETWSVAAEFSGEDVPVAVAYRTKPALTKRELGKGATLVVLAWPRVGVRVDGVEVGSTPSVLEIAPGAHHVKILRGDEEATGAVVVDAGGETRVFVDQGTDGRAEPAIEFQRLAP